MEEPHPYACAHAVAYGLSHAMGGIHSKLHDYSAYRSKATAPHHLPISRCSACTSESVCCHPAGLALLVTQDVYHAQYPQVFPHVIPERLARF